MSALLALLITGCAGDGTPAWAVDPVWLEPLDDTADTVFGFQTWQFYEEGWAQGYETRHYLCSVVVRLDGTAAPPCAECSHAWSVTTQVVEQDCDLAEGDLGQYLTLEQIGVAEASALTSVEAPYPGQTLVAYGDYGSGFEPYGWAYPAALETGDTTEAQGTYTASEPYQFLPTLLWDLR